MMGMDILSKDGQRLGFALDERELRAAHIVRSNRCAADDRLSNAVGRMDEEESCVSQQTK
jgi:hypothetical protein